MQPPKIENEAWVFSKTGTGSTLYNLPQIEEYYEQCIPMFQYHSITVIQFRYITNYLSVNI